jgi:hypothetical protein
LGDAGTHEPTTENANFPDFHKSAFGTIAKISSALPQLPTSRTAPAVEASDDHDPMLLHFEEYSAGKTAHSRTATSPVNGRKLQWILRYCLKRGFNRRCETLTKLRANVVIPCTRFQFASGVQTTGSVTVS